jgi:hypothetical protein
MPISPRIKQDLIDRLNEPRAFDLMNMFKGIPLVYKATLLNIDNDLVQFEVEPPSSVCLNWDSHTTILDDRNTNAIRSRVVAFDVIKGIVQLDDLAYFDRGMSHRTSVRVEPDEVIPATITRGEESVTGEVIDVSLTGFGIRVPTTSKVHLQLNDHVRVSLKMMDLLVGPRGSIVNIRKENDFNRLAFRFAEDVTIPVAIARYVIHRRAEIHREIRNAYYTAYTQNNPSQVP